MFVRFAIQLHVFRHADCPVESCCKFAMLLELCNWGWHFTPQGAGTSPHHLSDNSCFASTDRCFTYMKSNKWQGGRYFSGRGAGTSGLIWNCIVANHFLHLYRFILTICVAICYVPLTLRVSQACQGLSPEPLLRALHEDHFTLARITSPNSQDHFTQCT